MKMTDVSQERITLAQQLLTIPQVKKTLCVHLRKLIDKYQANHVAYLLTDVRFREKFPKDLQTKKLLANLLIQIREDDIEVDELYRHYLTLVCGDKFIPHA